MCALFSWQRRRFAAAWSCCWQEAGLMEIDIGRLVIAGAFGAYITCRQRHALGLCPTLPRERFVQVGNAAGLGVRRC